MIACHVCYTIHLAGRCKGRIWETDIDKLMPPLTLDMVVPPPRCVCGHGRVDHRGSGACVAFTQHADWRQSCTCQKFSAAEIYGTSSMATPEYRAQQLAENVRAWAAVEAAGTYHGSSRDPEWWAQFNKAPEPGRVEVM